MGLYEGIGSLIGIGNLFGNIGSAVGNYNLGREANDIDLQNLQFQERMARYQQNLQERIFNREDTAIQRRVEDLEAAGLSPILAAGQGARAGDAVKISTPQQGTTGKQMQAQALGHMRDIGRTAMDMLAIQSQINKTDAETNLINRTTPQTVELNSQKIQEFISKNKVLSNTVESTILKSNAEADSAFYKKEMDSIKAFDLSAMQEYVRDQWHVVGKKEYALTPKLLEYLSYKIGYQMKEMDMKVWEKLGGQATGNTALKLISGLIRQFVPSR